MTEAEFRDLADAFPFAAEVDDHYPPTRGGRAAAVDRLRAVDPAAYARTRNDLDGAATHLSPYLRHGVLSMAEVRNFAQSRGRSAGKLVQELAWHDYFQRVYRIVGGRVWDSLEPWKTGWSASDYAAELPEDIRQARTGVDWVDAFAAELHETGYLHNHARLWLAGYVCHARRVHWAAGAQWFLEHLLDGDPASNNLSWQWVASTFSHKPYLFNRQNVRKFSGDRFPAHSSADPMDDSYEALAAKLFRDGEDADFEPPDVSLTAQHDTDSASPPRGGGAVAWVHYDAVRTDHPAWANVPRRAWVWDDAHLQRRRWSLKRIGFLSECLPDVEHLETRRGDTAEQLLAFATEAGADRIVAAASPDPWVKSVVKTLRKSVEVEVVEDEPFVVIEGEVDLKRFSRYWRMAVKALK